jgi:drug/metabolite transporter superfamily protein YnfA
MMNGIDAVMLVVAASLEIGGDAAIRQGLIRTTWLWLALGAATLVAYGFVVNVNRVIDFGRLMGLYIAVFFVVSQLLSLLFFAERPSTSLIVGGALIVLGGVVIQVGRA